MMGYINNITERWQKLRPGNGKAVGAVLLQRNEANQWTAHGLALRLQKGVVSITDQWQQAIGPGTAPQNLPKDLPYVLVLDGKGVLHKPITANSPAAPVERLKEALPGVAPKDFYLQVTGGAETDFLSLIRRDVFDQLSGDWQAAGYWVVGTTLGPWVGAFLAAVLDPSASNQTVPAGNHRLDTRQGKPLSITAMQANGDNDSDNDTLTIGDQRLGRLWVPAYAAGLSWLLTGGIAPAPSIETVKQRAAEWRQRKRFEATGKGLLAGIFLLLLLNFVVFGHLRKQIGGLETQVSRLSASSGKENEIFRQMQQKKAFFEQNGWLHGTHHSFLADTLAAGLPPGIRLLELGIHPNDEKQSRQEKRLVFVSSTVVVKGVCASPGPLQEWMYRLGQSRWVASMGEPSYQFDPQLKAGVFTLTIQVKEGL